MTARFGIAFRNVLRNGRRTLLNVFMIGVGIAAIVVIEGFSQNAITHIETLAIDSQFGNVQVASQKYWHLSTDDSPKDRLFDFAPKFTEQVKAIPGVRYISGRISFFGLLSVGDRSLSARGIGFDPAKETQMLGSLHIVNGHNLTGASKFEIIIGSGLQNQLGAKVGQPLTLLGYTYEGAVNAIDCDLVGVFQTGSSEIDNSTFYTPLATAQRLLDTSLIENLVIQLNDKRQTDAVKVEVGKIAPTGTEVRAWHELAVFFQQVVNFCSVQSGVTETVVMLLALLAIANTVGMSITERIGEIGTVRALGDTRLDIVTQFLLEGLTLGILGALFGAVLGILAALFINWLKIPVFFPGASVPSLIIVDILPYTIIRAMIMTCVMAIIATLIPAITASRLKITDALKRNI